MEIQGEAPDLKGKMQLLMVGFEAAIKCQHGNKALWCVLCRGKDWLEVVTADGRTISQVVEEFMGRGIDWIEIEEYFGKEKKRRRIKKIAEVAGLGIISTLLLYQGGKLILRLIRRKEK